jgi:hypothetical protein
MTVPVKKEKKKGWLFLPDTTVETRFIDMVQIRGLNPAPYRCQALKRSDGSARSQWIWCWKKSSRLMRRSQRLFVGLSASNLLTLCVRF